MRTCWIFHDHHVVLKCTTSTRSSGSSMHFSFPYSIRSFHTICKSDQIGKCCGTFLYSESLLQKLGKDQLKINQMAKLPTKKANKRKAFYFTTTSTTSSWMDLLTVDSPQETIFLFHALWTFQSVDCGVGGVVFSEEVVAAKWWLGVTPSWDNLWVGLNLKWPTWSVTPSWHISGEGIVTSTFLGMLSYFGNRFWAQYSAMAKRKRGLVTALEKFRATKTYLVKLSTLLIWLLLRWQRFYRRWI